MLIFSSRLAALSCIVGFAGIVACSSPSDPPKWEDAFDTVDTGFLSSVWGSGPNDVFIVGGKGEGEIYHYDGISWEPMTVPDGAGLLVWVFGFGPNDVYSVGVGGTFIHYDGVAWSALDSGTSEHLWGIWGRSATEMWLVGGTVGSGEPILLGFDGFEVEDIGIESDQNPAGANALFKIWGIGSKVFAVGQLGLIVEKSGSSWTRVSAGAAADDDFVALWGTSESDIVVAGGRGSSQMAVYNGTTFDTVTPTGIGGTSAIFKTDEDFAYVGGSPGYIGRFTADDGELEIEHSTSFEVHALWDDGVDTTYAVGGIGVSPYPGIALKRQR